MIGESRIPSPAVRVALDVLLVLWVAAWIALGVVVGREVQALESLAGTTVTAGEALESAGRALGSVGDIPLVGDEVGAVAEETQEAGRSAAASGRETQGSINHLSILLGAAIAVVPSLPYVLLYLPIRLSWRRQIRGLRRVLDRAPNDQAIAQFLAFRAVQNLPYDALVEASPTPWRGFDEGSYERLARAELRRLGIEPRAARVTRSAKPS